MEVASAVREVREASAKRSARKASGQKRRPVNGINSGRRSGGGNRNRWTETPAKNSRRGSPVAPTAAAPLAETVAAAEETEEAEAVGAAAEAEEETAGKKSAHVHVVPVNGVLGKRRRIESCTGTAVDADDGREAALRRQLQAKVAKAEVETEVH